MTEIQPGGSSEPKHNPEASEVGNEQAPAVVYYEDLGAEENPGHNPFIRAAYGRSGHEIEYVIGIPGYDHEQFIPMDFARVLQEALGDGWEVMNRGTRLEVMPRGAEGPDDEVVNRALLLMAERFELNLPIIFNRPTVREPVDREAVRREMREKLRKIRESRGE